METKQDSFRSAMRKRRGLALESRKIAGGRPGVVQMNAAASLAPGVYWLRLRQGSLPQGMRTSIARVAVVR